MSSRMDFLNKKEEMKKKSKCSVFNDSATAASGVCYKAHPFDNAFLKTSKSREDRKNFFDLPQPDDETAAEAAAVDSPQSSEVAIQLDRPRSAAALAEAEDEEDLICTNLKCLKMIQAGMNRPTMCKNTNNNNEKLDWRDCDNEELNELLFLEETNFNPAAADLNDLNDLDFNLMRRNKSRTDNRSAQADAALKRKYYKANRIFYNGYLSNPENVLNKLEYQAHAAELLNFLKSLWQTNTMCDLVILPAGGNKSYPCHRLALAMFSTKYKEEFQKKSVETSSVMFKIHLSSSSTEAAIQAILKYIYTAEIDINPSNADEILAASKELAIENLVYLANDYLNSLSIGDILDYMSNIFDKEGADLMFYELYSYMMRNLDKVVRTPEFLKSSRSTAKAILNDSHLKVSSELAVFDAALKWLNYDQKNRNNGDQMADLFSSVRFTLMSPTDLACRVECQTGIMDDVNVLKQLYGAFKYHALLKSHQSNSSSLIKREEARNLSLHGASVPEEFIKGVKELASIAHNIKSAKKFIRYQKMLK